MDRVGKHLQGDFIWGVATSAYQIEGAPLEDGAGESIWDRFTAQPGRIIGGDHGDRACDHYHRHAEDLALLRALGVDAYRFSIAWSRVLPEGRGRLNTAGLDFYDRWTDCLLDAGIQPWPTLYHWDLPAALDDEGGWLSPDIPRWFAEYAHTVFRRLGDRISHWVTLNEPWVVAHCGYLTGEHAPGHQNRKVLPTVVHHLLLAHAGAARALRQESSSVQTGLVVNLEPQYAASATGADQRAVRHMEAYKNRLFLDPLFRGRYPEAMDEFWEPAWPQFPAEELALIQGSVDFIGVNYYTRQVIRADAGGMFGVSASSVSDAQHTTMGWEVYPSGLYDILVWVHGQYGDIPLYVTENGAAFEDPEPDSHGVIADTQRIAYLEAHIAQMDRASGAGVPLHGYFVWSLLDNFEWGYGYAQRFGLVHIDRTTLKRTPKASFHAYRAIVAASGSRDTRQV
ncbi:MAG: hypothetical protein RIQ52_974 [Pseudomonadota bacterium]|jgi:beta-glucosidase